MQWDSFFSLYRIFLSCLSLSHITSSHLSYVGAVRRLAGVKSLSCLFCISLFSFLSFLSFHPLSSPFHVFLTSPFLLFFPLSQELIFIPCPFLIYVDSTFYIVEPRCLCPKRKCCIFRMKSVVRSSLILRVCWNFVDQLL